MKTKKILVEVVAATMIVAPLAQPARVFNVHALDTTPVVQTTETTPVLQDATVVIPTNATIEQVKDIIGKAVIKNYESVDLQNIEWEYECEGKNKLNDKNTAWGSIGGFTSEAGKIFKEYTHPSLAANSDGTYNLRIKGSDDTVQLTKTAKLKSDITLKNDVSITLPYKDADTIDYDALREAIFDQVVESSDPELKLEDVTIQYNGGTFGGFINLEGEKGNLLKPAMTVGTHEIKVSYAGNDTYYGTTAETTVTFNDRAEAEIEVNKGETVKLPYNEDATVDYDALKKDIFKKVVKSSNPELTADDVTIKYEAPKAVAYPAKYVDLRGEKVTGHTYPAISEGEQKIQITYAGDKNHNAKTVETTINVVDREEPTITVNEDASAKLVYNDDLTIDYNKVKEEIFKNVVKESHPELTVDDVTIQYYGATSTSLFKDWVDLAGETKNGLKYQAISEGNQQIQITYAGNKDYKPVTVKTTVNVVDRATVTVNKNEGPYNVSMAFNDDQSYDYEGTAKAIYKAVVASTDPELSYEDFKVEYNADPTSIMDVWYSLDNDDSINLNRFGAGTWEIRLSWNGTKEYKPGNITVKVNVQDNRLESNVAIKEGTSITYNMDANEMKKALFDAIDFDNSTLPAKEELSVDDFTYEYYGENVLADNISGGVKRWAPIEGGKVTENLVPLDYPQMPAGEQKVRVTYKGNKNYRPSTSAETTITVKKAKVSVKVHSTNIFADEKVPEGFITTNPADKFDVYTVYAGATSNVSTGLYLDLPARYMNSSVLKMLDPVVEKIAGKTFTQMMQDGVTVGELRKLLSTQDLLDLLEKLHIDTGTFGQILTVINKLPGIADNVRVGFGTPNKAGLYAVTAITDNKNYETGVGVGALLVKMHSKGVKLNWNQTISGGKMTQEEAQEFDFGVTLSYNGDTTIAQDNIHFLYTGFTSKFKPYTSTTKAPTEPGLYTVTVVTLGGNYQAAPITRTFRITK